MAEDHNTKRRRVVTSFMLRFVYEAETAEAGPGEEVLTPYPAADSAGSGPTTAWRGVVKHIQSGAEYNFSRMADAEAFIMKHIKQ